MNFPYDLIAHVHNEILFDFFSCAAPMTSLEGANTVVPSPNNVPLAGYPSVVENIPLHYMDDVCRTPQKHIIPFSVSTSILKKICNLEVTRFLMGDVLQGFTCTPQVPDALQPAVGMEFDDVQSAENFYKDYAHEAGFSVRIGQHTVANDVVIWKRFYCSREGFRGEGKKKVVAPSKKVCKKKKRKYVQKSTRCGCEAMLAIKRTTENKYRIEIFQPAHVHNLISPKSRRLIRSNRQVREKVKTTLFHCHKAGIGPSLVYRYLRVNEGGFENVGCTLRDAQNYHFSTSWKFSG